MRDCRSVEQVGDHVRAKFVHDVVQVVNHKRKMLCMLFGQFTLEVQRAESVEDPVVVERLQEYFRALKRPDPLWTRIVRKIRRMI